MEVTSTKFKHCDLITVQGRIDSATSPQLAEAFSQVTDEGRFRFVLDMKGVDFLSSAGLRILINNQKTCKRYNRGEIVLAEVPENIFKSLDLAGFTSLFKIFDNVVSAVGNF